jgi:hypothetical protein
VLNYVAQLPCLIIENVELSLYISYMLAKQDSLACGYMKEVRAAATIDKRQKRNGHDSSVKMEVIRRIHPRWIMIHRSFTVSFWHFNSIKQMARGNLPFSMVAFLYRELYYPHWQGVPSCSQHRFLVSIILIIYFISEILCSRCSIRRCLRGLATSLNNIKRKWNTLW